MNWLIGGFVALAFAGCIYSAINEDQAKSACLELGYEWVEKRTGDVVCAPAASNGSAPVCTPTTRKWCRGQ